MKLAKLAGVAVITGLAGFIPPVTAKDVKPEIEFKRALSIIENTQLEIYTDTPPEPADRIFSKLDKLSATDATVLDPKSPNFDEKLGEKRIDIMRTLLSETIDAYNDQYANYISPEELKRYKERRSGNYQGVGLKFRAMEDDYPVVIGALIGGPLDNTDLLPGDKMVEANQTDLKGLSSREIITLLKGPDKSRIDLKIQRADGLHHVVTSRGPVKLKYARAEIINSNIGYIQISRFGGKTHETVAKLLEELLDQKVKALVLDLRNNPGGSTRAARAIVSMFSKEQNIYCEKHKSGTVKLLPRHGDHLTDLPLAVLVNGNSMSSSEIVAGAIKTYDRGTVIGTPTYGKGLVQRVFNLAQPLGGAIRTTIAVFGRPDHQAIHATGIVPDIYIETPADFMFRRTGSLNIKSNARAYQRALLEKGVKEKHPDKANALINAPDAQLNTAIAELNKQIKTNGG